MRTWPVIWLFHGCVSAGSLGLGRERLVLTGRERTFAFRREEVEGAAIEREPGCRLRGLPVLAVRLDTGDSVRIASLGGIGSLHELAAVVSPHQAAAGT